MSIRSVDMQHTLQQVAAAERVQAIDKGQAEQEAQQFARKLERAEAEREQSVPETAQAEHGKVTASNPEERGGRRRRRRREPDEDAGGRPGSSPPDGEIHLIDVRV